MVEISVSSFVSNKAQSALFLGILAWPFIATRSMYDHVKAVATPLTKGDLATARLAVSMIVGRDPSALNEAGVSRAALESLAENTSDGIVAPIFWGLVAGLPGIVAYKAINTLDSMIGHRTERYEAFGWASARIDDLVNLIPARLTGPVVRTGVPPSARLMGRDDAGCKAPPLAQCRMARGGDGRRFKGATFRPEGL